MNVDEFDYGSEDARNLNLKSDGDRKIFLDSYVLPRKFKLENFLHGDKYFVYGRKGSGKTALLQYIKIHAEKERGATTHFYYFQSAFSKKEMDVFLARQNKLVESLVDDRSLSDPEEASVFWRLFILIEISKVLRRAKVTEGPAANFIKLVEAAKLISQAKNVGAKYPNLQKFSVNLSKNPGILIEGTFENAELSDLETYLELSDEELGNIFLGSAPVYFFIDEMETYIRGDASDDLRLSAIASLIRAVRNFNEKHVDSDIFLIAAVRDTVVDRVSIVQGEVYRIIRDNGVEVDWPHSVKRAIHPLERMVLSRIVVQDPEFSSYSTPISQEFLNKAIEKYFPYDGALREAINLTWYRPRDVALFFDEASGLDHGHQKFQRKTLVDGVIKPLGRRLWQDAISGLAIKYNRRELDGIERIFRGGMARYDRNDFLDRLEVLSHQYDDVALLSDSKWMQVVEDLYGVGVLYSITKKSGHKNFVFRGDPIPSLTTDFSIAVHRSLLKELAIQV